MWLYILKSSLCLLAFICFYKLFLERESVHKFKRFYLLGALTLSFFIPLITFTEYIEPAPFNNETVSDLILTTNQQITENNSPSKNYLPMILWCIYLLGSTIFGFRFVKNLYQISNTIKSNTHHKNHRFINVLLREKINPHSFFRYIFLNKHKFEQNLIPKEVLLHEQTHATQLHALDTLILEVAQILLWFNPLIYILKRSIKLNHEFLADQYVISQGGTPTEYQNLLLAFSSNALEPQLANAINYSSIKKRLTVMKTKTSKTKLWSTSLVLLPLLVILIYGLSSHKTIVKDNTQENSIQNHTARSIEIEVLKNGTYKIDGISATKASFVETINTLHQDISTEIRNRIINIHINDQKKVADEEVWFIYNAVIDYGFYRIVTYNQEIIRSKGNTPFAINNSDNKKYQQKATIQEINEYNQIIQKVNSYPENSRIFKQKVVERLQNIYNKMSAPQKANAEPFPKFPKQQKATKKQLAEYNKLAVYYNKMLTNKENTRILMQDVEQLKYIYSLMTEKQRKKAEPFPNFPPPPKAPKSPTAPKPPKAPNTNAEMTVPKPPKPRIKRAIQTPDSSKTGFIEINGEDYFYAIKDGKTKYYNRWGIEVDKQGNKLSTKQTDGKNVVEGQKISKVYKNNKVVAEFKKTWDDKEFNQIPPPPPPKPKAPLDYVIEKAKEGASFYYNDKKITSDKAIDLLKNDKNLHISSKSQNGKAVVKIQNKPITL